MFYVQVFPTCFLHQVVCSFPSFDIVDWLLLARDCEAIKHWYVHELHLDYQQLFDAWHRLSHHKQSTCLMSIVPGWWREENVQLIYIYKFQATASFTNVLDVIRQNRIIYNHSTQIKRLPYKVFALIFI